MHKQRIAIALGLTLAFTYIGIAAQQNPQQRETKPETRELGGERAFGTITSVGVDRLAIKKIDGSTQTVMVDDKTQYRQGQQEIKLEDLKPGDRVGIRSHLNSDKEWVAVMVRRITEEEAQRFQNSGDRVFGEIVSIENNQIKVHNRVQGEQIVVVNDQTVFMKQGEPITLKDLKAGDRIFALGKEAEGKFVAIRVFTGQFRGPNQQRNNPER
jgi:membrane carboxypeptidase/penicillin-binding protein